MPSPSSVVHLRNHSLSWDDCRLLVDSVVDYAIFLLDPTGHVSSWNPGANRLKGYAPDEVIGKHLSVFYTPEDQASGRPESLLESARREGRVEDEGWRVRKDGSRFWANVVITALRDETGAARGFAKITRDLTDRHAAEETVRKSEERFRLLVDNIADYAIYLLDASGKVTTWNLGAERMKGYVASEVLERNFEVFFPEEDIASGKPARELAAAASHGKFEDEGWRVRKDGSRFWANAIVTALYDAHGGVQGYAKITRDLTVRREAEEKARQLAQEQTARRGAEEAERQVRESEEKYRALSRRLEIVFEGIADGITVQDRTGKVVFANTAAARACGLETVAELMNTPPAEIVARFEMLDAEGNPFPAERLPARRVFAGEGAGTATMHIRERATGRDWWVQLKASPAGDVEGKPELAINIWHDITVERRQEVQARYLSDATAALGKSLDYDEMLSTLAEVLVPGLGDWCSVYMLEGDQVRNVAVAHGSTEKSEAVEHYRHRYPPQKGGTNGVWHVIESGLPEVVNDITDAMLVASTSDPEALALLRTIGMKAVLIVPIRARSTVLGALALVSADPKQRYDRSDIALAEELGRRAGVALENAQLYLRAQASAKSAEEAAKIAEQAAKAAEEASRAKDEFLATVSHELRTPLNAIVGWSSLLKDRVTDPLAVKPIEIVHRNALAQVRIIDDILDVSRVITGKFRLDPKPTDLVVITREAMDVVRPSADAKRIALDFAPDVDYCLLVADPERLQQVIWNLLSNAVKFTEPDGRIDISVRQDGAQVTLQVSDTGKGIEPSFLPLVFERFRQADSSTTRRFGGLGLGLALVRHIVELHGGRASAASAGLGKGATFLITLPIRAVVPATAEVLATASRATSPSSAALRPVGLVGVRVLVVDDESDARDLVATALMEAGAEVETAASAEDGFETFKRFKPDVLVSDIGMPGEDGYSLMRRIRSLPVHEGSKIPSLALTAFTRDEDRNRAIGSGFTTHVGKPVSPRALVDAVGNLADIWRSNAR